MSSRAETAPTLAAATVAVAEADHELTEALDRWRAVMIERLDELSTALVQHTEQTEAADGLFASILTDAPHLRSTVDRLTDEHGVLTVRIADITRAATALSPTEEPEAVRALHQSVHELITLLDGHLHRNCQMTYDAASQEFGGPG